MEAVASIAFSLLCSIFSGGLVWGVTREKVTRLEKDCEKLGGELESIKNDFVSHKHFEAVIEPMRQDVKEILRILTSKGDSHG